MRPKERRTTMSYACSRCGTTLVETDDDVNDYEGLGDEEDEK